MNKPHHGLPCSGTQKLTPVKLRNRPGQSSVNYRVGSHAAFLETMLARLSQLEVDVHPDGVPITESNRSSRIVQPLLDLSTRESNDPSIAFMDAWALVADILSFYQERIANEGYLRTARERRSIHELSKLVGYKLKPGLSASTHLAFTVEEGAGEIVIPKGTAVQTIPAQNELPQTFETMEDIKARPEWNEIKPVTKRVPNLSPGGLANITKLVLNGTNLKLNKNDYLVFEFLKSSDSTAYRLKKIVDVEVNNETSETTVHVTQETLSRSSFIKLISVNELRFSIKDPYPREIFEIDVAAELEGDKPANIIELDDQLEALIGSIKKQQASIRELTPVDALKSLFERFYKRQFEEYEVQSLVDAEQILFPTKLKPQLIDLGNRIVEESTKNAKPIVESDLKSIGKDELRSLREAFADHQGEIEKDIELRELVENVEEILEQNWLEFAGDGLDILFGGDGISEEESKQIQKALSNFINSKLVKIESSEDPVQLLKYLANLKNYEDLLSPLFDKENDTWERIETLVDNSSLAEKVKNEFSIHGIGLLAILIGQSYSDQFPTPDQYDNIFDFFSAEEQAILGLEVEFSSLKFLVEMAALRSSTETKKIRNVGFQEVLEEDPTITNAEGFLRLFGAWDKRFIALQKIRLELKRYLAHLETNLRRFGKASSEFRARVFDLVKAELERFDRDGITVTPPRGAPQGWANLKTLEQLLHILEFTRQSKVSEIVSACKEDEWLASIKSNLQDLETIKEIVRSNLDKIIDDLVYKDESSEPVSVSTAGDELANVSYALQSSGIESSAGSIKSKAVSDLNSKLLKQFGNDTGGTLYDAWRKAPPTPITYKVYGVSDKAQMFGATVPGKIPKLDGTGGFNDTTESEPQAETPFVIYLDRDYKEAKPGFVVIEQYQTIEKSEVANDSQLSTDGLVKADAYRVDEVAFPSLAEYGTSITTTRMVLRKPWIDAVKLNAIRNCSVFWKSRELSLAKVPVSKEVVTLSEKKLPQDLIGSGAHSGDVEANARQVELDELYEGLEVGQRIVVAGDNVNYDVPFAKTFAIKNVNQIVRTDLPLDKVHTLLEFEEPIAVGLKRETVTLFANLAEATHGESQQEVLGNGSSATPKQTLQLSKTKISQLPAFAEAGFKPELFVDVDDVTWQEGANFPSLSSADEKYIVDTDDRNQTTITFGDGLNGTRLPTGIGNVKSMYRVGLGRLGNVGKDRISQIKSPPLGVEKANNPVTAVGGIDPESLSQGRRNLSIKTACLNRIVSVKDYEFFTRNFAGIAKASATKTNFRGKELTHITIAATDDVPLAEDSLIFKNLIRSIEKSGGGKYFERSRIEPNLFSNGGQDVTDGQVGFHVGLRRRILLKLSAKVRVSNRVKAEPVLNTIRQRLLSRFSFENAEFGGDVHKSDVLATIQSVPHVLSSNISSFAGVVEAESSELLEIPIAKINLSKVSARRLHQQISVPLEADKELVASNLKRYFVRLKHVDGGKAHGLFPAEIAYFPPDIPEMIQLEEVE